MSSGASMRAILSVALVLGVHLPVAADDAAEISKNAHAALQSLYAKVDGANSSIKPMVSKSVSVPASW